MIKILWMSKSSEDPDVNMVVVLCCWMTPCSEKSKDEYPDASEVPDVNTEYCTAE